MRTPLPSLYPGLLMLWFTLCFKRQIDSQTAWRDYVVQSGMSRVTFNPHLEYIDNSCLRSFVAHRFIPCTCCRHAGVRVTLWRDHPRRADWIQVLCLENSQYQLSPQLNWVQKRKKNLSRLSPINVEPDSRVRLYLPTDSENRTTIRDMFFHSPLTETL